MKEIKNKKLFKKICEEEVIRVAMEELDKLSKDREERLAYESRLDELYIYNSVIQQIAETKAAYNSALTVIAEKDETIAEKDAIIAELRARLGEAN